MNFLRDPSPPRGTFFRILRFCRVHPVLAFLTLFFVMLAGVCISALHRTGTDSLLLGPWSHLSW
jgi:hypothetical protein